MAVGMAEKNNNILSYRFSSPHTNGQVSVLGSSNVCKLSKRSWCGCQQHNPSKSHCALIFTEIPPYFFSKFGYNYQMLAGYIVNTAHERSFKDNRLFKKQYWHGCVSTGLSATTTCRLGFLRWEQQFCSQPPVGAPPPIMFSLFLDVLFLLLYHTLSDCRLPYKQ